MKSKFNFFNLLPLCLTTIFCLSLSANSQTINFRDYVNKRFGKNNFDKTCSASERVQARVFADYGAIFAADDDVAFPNRCVFLNESQVFAYQNAAKPKASTLGGITIELQEPAMDALMDAVKEAAKKNLRITPRGGSIAARRSYEDTAKLWNSRFYPGLAYWQKRGAITRKDAENAKAMQINEQVAKVLEWESKRLWFSTDFTKSILYSVAAPGASQHIFMLALDVEQFANRQVRDILAKHGWFQTVQSDLPHFTYLGVNEDKLPSLGLKSVTVSGQKFWIPNLD